MEYTTASLWTIFFKRFWLPALLLQAHFSMALPSSTINTANTSFSSNTPDPIVAGAMLSSLPLQQALALTTTEQSIHTPSTHNYTSGPWMVQAGADGSYGTLHGTSPFFVNSQTHHQAAHSTFHYKLMDLLEVGGVTGLSHDDTTWQGGGGYRNDSQFLSAFARLRLQSLDTDLTLAQTHQDYGTQTLTYAGTMDRATTVGGIRSAALNMRFKFGGDSYMWGPLFNISAQHLWLGSLEGQNPQGFSIAAQKTTSTLYGMGLYGNAWRDVSWHTIPLGKVRLFAFMQRQREGQYQPYQTIASPNSVPSASFAYTTFVPGKIQDQEQIGLSWEYSQHLQVSLISNNGQGVSSGWGQHDIGLGVNGVF